MPPHPRTKTSGALQRNGWIVALHQPVGAFIQHLPGILQPCAHAVLPLGSVEKLWGGGSSALPRAISSPATWQDRLLQRG